MSWRQLFFGFNGRINRKPYWLGVLALILMGTAGILGASFITALSKEGKLPLPPEIGLGLLLAIFGLMLFASLALSVKRLHDRGKSGWWMALYFGFGALYESANQLGLTGPADAPNTLGIALAFASLAIGLWYLIELGFRRGEPGTNRYGANPLSGMRADASM